VIVRRSPSRQQRHQSISSFSEPHVHRYALCALFDLG
jgi:hypothetical protein